MMFRSMANYRYAFLFGDFLKENPFQNPPSYEKVIGDMEGLYSRRIYLKHRLVYQVYEEEKIVKVVSAWSHYENV